MTQYAIGEDGFPEFADRWRCYLRASAASWWHAALEEAKRRKNFHEAKDTPQTSKREQLPRSLYTEWRHLKGEAALTSMLAARGYAITLEDLGWGRHTPAARERSRRGNVLPGVSVYVPEKVGDGLIVRRAERVEYPELRYVLIWEHRSGRRDEYLACRGHLLAEESAALGSPWGPRGTPLREKGDLLVAPTRLHSMDTFLEAIQ